MNKPDWIIHFVFPEEGDYECQMDIHTHGLSKYNHPELGMVLALPQETAGAVLNSIGFRIREGETFSEEGIYKNILADEMPVKIVKTEVGNHEQSVLLLPDPNGYLPDEPECTYPYNMQLQYLQNIKELYEDSKER